MPCDFRVVDLGYGCNGVDRRPAVDEIHGGIAAFPSLASPSENHAILARLPIRTCWTTNYDKLIETALTDARKTPDVKHVDSQLPVTKPKRDAVLYKMHGDVDHPQDAVLTRDDYEAYGGKHLGFVNALVGDLTGKTFLFIGFSFLDPNLDHVLSQLRLNSWRITRRMVSSGSTMAATHPRTSRRAANRTAAGCGVQS